MTLINKRIHVGEHGNATTSMSSAVQNSHNAIRLPAKRVRRWLYALLTFTTALSGVLMMTHILNSNGMSLLDGVILFLFSIAFAWISTSFWSALFGFILLMLRRDPLTLQANARRGNDAIGNETENETEIKTEIETQINTRTAIVMPIYNEDIERVIAGFEATLTALANSGPMDPMLRMVHFDFFLLSDTTDQAIAQTELDAWQQFIARIGALSAHVFYRRRDDNLHRKVGNISDFLQRWGADYEHMIIMDADSILSSDCILQLVRRMQANPRAGLMQTVPIPVRQTSLFGRFIQFSSALYSPMLATGCAFWQTDAANYWGHNAIIRVAPFIAHCDLPTLPGKAPFGGDILSHDFVEAAFLRRAGWDVFLLAGLEGSYEEVPSNMIDYAIRDRRWAQGNIQHLGLLRVAGLHKMSRLHFLLGAVAYIASLVWLLMLAVSTIAAWCNSWQLNAWQQKSALLPSTTTLPQHLLQPDWSVPDTGMTFSLILFTTALLMLPKVLGVIATLCLRRQQFGGTKAILRGAIAEALFAILIAPILLSFHATFVISILLGVNVEWDAQDRQSRLLRWKESIQRTFKTTACATVWAFFTFIYTPHFFWWLVPILPGLLLTPAIVRYSSSTKLGQLCRRLSLFLSPSEVDAESILRLVQQQLSNTTMSLEHSANQPELPKENRSKITT